MQHVAAVNSSAQVLCLVTPLERVYLPPPRLISGIATFKRDILRFVYSLEGQPWPNPPDTSMSLQDRHVNTVKQTEQEHGIHLLDPPPARKTQKMELFCVWFERQGIESAFPSPPQNCIVHIPGHLGFVTPKTTLCLDFHRKNLDL